MLSLSKGITSSSLALGLARSGQACCGSHARLNWPGLLARVEADSDGGLGWRTRMDSDDGGPG